MFLDEHVMELPPESAQAPPEPTVESQRGPWPWVGVLAIVLAVSAGIAQIAAINGAAGGDLELGIVLGYLAISLAIAAVLAGVAAIVARRGRRAGVVGIVLGLVANPLVLLAILRFFDGAVG